MKKILFVAKRNPLIFPALLIMLFWIGAALFGPSLTPFTYSQMDMESQLSSPGTSGHLLGTDALGRDILSRIIYGSRSILTIALLTSLFSSLAGIIIGFTAGYFGGTIDRIFLRTMDILMAIPPLVLSMVVLGVLGHSDIKTLTLIVSIVYTPATARVARGALLSCKNMEYVDAGRLRGESHFYIMFREILPNTIGPIIVEITARFAYSIMMVASLGFLGVGLQPPTPDWGMMVIENKTIIKSAPWAVLYPSLAIASLVIAISLFSDFLSKVVYDDQ
jgi:peptide/nickel transport system permease protein